MFVTVKISVCFSIFPVVFTKYCVSVYLDRDLSHLQDFGGLLPSNSVPNNEFSPLQVSVLC